MDGMASIFDIGEDYFLGIRMPGPKAEESVSDYLSREERIQTLAREVRGRPVMKTEPLLLLIFRAIERGRRKGKTLYGMWQEVRKAAARYLRDLSNRALEEFYSDGRTEALTPEELSGKGREAYEELLFLCRGIYTEEAGMKPDPFRGRYRADPWSRMSFCRPFVLRRFEETPAEDDRQYVFYPELKERYRGAAFTNGYRLTDSFAVAPIVIAELIRRTCEKSPTAGGAARHGAEAAFLTMLEKSDGMAVRLPGIDESVSDEVIRFARKHGIDCANAKEDPEEKVKTFYITDRTFPVVLFGAMVPVAEICSGSEFRGENLLGLLEILYDEYRREELKRNYERITASGYAEVYEDKKHIPVTTVRAMERSPFNRYFGYVEYDRLVREKDVNEVFKDFDAVIRTFFNGITVKDYEIRFRFLGRHRAAGLFYGGRNCLCVDLRCPWSLMHEFFHLYDHDRGDLSSGWEFREVRKQYEKLLLLWKRAHKDEAGRLKGKYDLSYYLTPTEIFARCGEIYLLRIMGVRNSVTGGELSGFQYPSDERLEHLIREYFGKELAKGRLVPALYQRPEKFSIVKEAAAS